MFNYGRESIVLQRDVNAVRIPDGTTEVLTEGQVVNLYQSLGGNFTVTTEWGHLLRISGEDADALGKEPPALGKLESGTDPQAVEHNVWEVLKTIYDPEIPVNIVDLGLVYQCLVRPNPDGGNDVHVIMTLTAPGCGMGPVLQYDAEAAIKKLPGVRSVNVEVVFDPPWSREMVSEVGKLQLGML